LTTPPPQAVEQMIRVRRAESIEIPLRIYGTRAQTLEFRIRSAPRAGKLSAIRQTGPERAVVTYTPPADAAIDADEFSYAVRSKEGVSAAANVTVRILDDPAKLVVPDALDFGNCLAGDEAMRSLEIANEGGRAIEGVMQIDPPWRIEGAREYHLEAGGRATFAVRFAPKEKGAFRGEVRFISEQVAEPACITSLHGTAESAISLAPARVELNCASKGSLRSGSFSVINHSGAAITVAFAGSPRLNFVRELQLAPHETQEVQVSLADDDPAPLSAELRAEPHGTIAVEGPALPARFVADRSNIRLSAAPGGGKATPLRIENRGGMAAEARLEIAAPFSVEPAVARLAPGESVDARITMSATPTAAPVRGELLIRGGETVLRVNVEPEFALAQASAANTRRPTRDGPLVQINAEAQADSQPHLLVDNREGIFPQPIYPRELGKGRAVIEWPASLSPASKFRAFEQQVSLRAGALQIDWREYPAFQTERQGPQFVGTLTNLQPARLYIMRIVPLFENGQTGAPLVEVRFRTPPEKRSRFRITPMRVLVVLLCAGAVLAIRQRFKSA
jgi:hypothetical protein